MKNFKSTKNALILSALSLLLCVTMLVGTTYAWFTDSVTSSNNIIASGNLDVELEYSKDFSSWATIKDSTEIFDKTAHWEPGYTEVVYLKLSNLGSLALRYQFALEIKSEDPGTNADGDPIKLSEHIKFGVVKDVTAKYTERADAIDDIDTVKKLADGYTDSGEMKSGDPAKYMALVVYMPTTVTNEANHNGTDVPSIALGLKVKATQLNTATESDSFGSDYDMYAEYADGTNNPNISVGTAVELKTALNNLMAGQSVTLTQDIDLTGATWEVSSPWNGAGTNVVFDGGGHKITGLTTSGGECGGLFGRIATNGNMTIKNLVLENVNITGTDINGECAGGALIGWYETHGGVLTVENVQVNGIKASGFKYIGGLIGYNNVDHAVNITNCTVNGTELNSTYNESGNYKGHVGGLVGYYGNGTITGCTVSNLAVKRDATDLTTSSNRAGALAGTITANGAVASATVSNVTVDGVAASADNVFGPGASASTVSKANITIA